MRNIVFAVAAATLLVAFAQSASAQTLDFELAMQPLGLDRAVRIEGRPCLMTTPYDKWARCGTERITFEPCAYPAFEDNKLVCRPSPFSDLRR